MLTIEQNVVGTWRSYKLFYFTGKAEQHNTASYIEFSVDADRVLTMRHAQTKNQVLFLKPGEWKIDELKKRRYLVFGKRQAYEIITLEPDDLVITDIVKGEKIFFAKMPGWYQRIEPEVNAVRHVRQTKKTGKT